MQQQVKTALGTIIILIFAVTAGYFVWQYEKIQPEVAQPTQSVSQTSTSAAKGIIYTNNDYGFQLTLPKEWKDYKTINTKTNQYHSITFGLPIIDENWPSDEFPKGYGEIFSVGVENIADWTKKCNSVCKADFAPICIDCTETPQKA